jgi:ABC-type transport system substrate-binding protein
MAVPTQLPIEPDGINAPVVSAGPYFIKEWTRNRRVVLERNKFYRGQRPHRVDRIEVDIGLPLETIKLNIDRNATDAGDIPPSAHAELGRRFGVKRRSPGRYFVNARPEIAYLAFNHDRPLFHGPSRRGNIPLKQAINYAIDRRALIVQYGAYAGSVHDQLLPPMMPGFKDAKLYPRHPDIARARTLAEDNLRGGRARLYCSNRAPAPQVCQLVQAQLRQIDLAVEVRLFPRAPYESPSVRGFPVDIFEMRRRVDYFDPYDFIFLIDGTTIRPANNTNLSYFSHPRYDARIKRARGLTGAERYQAFHAIDRDLMRKVAPVAVYGTLNDRHYVSARTGCYHHHPVYGFDLSAICLKR